MDLMSIPVFLLREEVAVGRGQEEQGTEMTLRRGLMFMNTQLILLAN